MNIDRIAAQCMTETVESKLVADDIRILVQSLETNSKVLVTTSNYVEL